VAEYYAARYGKRFFLGTFGQGIHEALPVSEEEKVRGTAKALVALKLPGKGSLNI
jgi:hypothetical protein